MNWPKGHLFLTVLLSIGLCIDAQDKVECSDPANSGHEDCFVEYSKKFEATILARMRGATSASPEPEEEVPFGVNFLNKLQFPARIYFTEGKDEILQGTLGPGQGAHITTYTGHIFVAKRIQGGKETSIYEFRMTSACDTLIIGEDAMGGACTGVRLSLL